MKHCFRLSGVYGNARAGPREPDPPARHCAEPAHDDDCRASSPRVG